MSQSLDEREAAVTVLNFILQQADKSWPDIYQNFHNILQKRNLPTPKSDVTKFQFTLAATSLNLRAAFMLFPPEQAKRIYGFTMDTFRQNFPNEKLYTVISRSVDKYLRAHLEAGNELLDPNQHVAKYLYYTLGFQNRRQSVVDRGYSAPDPTVVAFLTNSLIRFTEKWQALTSKYVVQPVGNS